MRIRQAYANEAATLTQIAHDAKRHWGYPEHWIQHWQSDLSISSDFINNLQVHVAENDGELIGFYALSVRDGKAELEHLWVAPAHIGKGVGKELFIHAMQMAAAQNVSAVDVLSDPNAEGFYERMGAQRIGEVASEIDRLPRVLPRMRVDPNRS